MQHSLAGDVVSETLSCLGNDQIFPISILFALSMNPAVCMPEANRPHQHKVLSSNVHLMMKCMYTYHSGTGIHPLSMDILVPTSTPMPMLSPVSKDLDLVHSDHNSVPVGVWIHPVLGYFYPSIQNHNSKGHTVFHRTVYGAANPCGNPFVPLFLYGCYILHPLYQYSGGLAQTNDRLRAPWGISRAPYLLHNPTRIQTRDEILVLAYEIPKATNHTCDVLLV